MRFPYLQLLISLTLFIGPNGANASNITFKKPDLLTVCSYSEFKPVIYGAGEGYEADLLRAVAELWQVDIRFFPERIYEGIWRLPSRAYTLCDVSAGGMSPTKGRMEEDAEFSTMTTMFNQSLLIRKQDFTSGRIVAYRSFKNTPMKIGVVPGTTGEKYAYARAKENDLPTSLFVQYASESDLLPALLNHKIDAIARGEIGNEYQASLNSNLMTIAKKKCNEGFAFGVDKSNTGLLLRLNQAIHDITNNGAITYDDWLKNHDVFSRRVKQILGEKHVTIEKPVKSATLPQSSLQQKNKTAQVKEPDLTPTVMV
jgi:ABC-type amino acid transport substrate-binding protein